MNRLEFNEVLKAVGINNHLVDTIGRYGTREKVHFWKDMAIYFGGNYYTVIAGRIPLEVANIIYEKYPGNPYGIRVKGGCSDYIPSEYATDDQYKQEFQKLIEQHLDANHFLAECEKSRKKMNRRTDENKYIETYHIDSKEGLIIFLTEIKDYYARKQGLNETEVQRFDEILATVCEAVIKEVDPSITSYDWMRGDKQLEEAYLNAIKRSQSRPFGNNLREIIDRFDKTVNPFINDKIELDAISSYLQKVDIDGETHDMENGIYRKNCCSMIIKAKDSKNEVRYYRSSDGFSYQLVYVLGLEEYVTILHYFSNEGEHIYINYFGDNSKQKVDLRYNITEGTCGEKEPITQEQMGFVYDEIEKAIGLASTITIDNMTKRGSVKKIEPQKVN